MRTSQGAWDGIIRLPAPLFLASILTISLRIPVAMPESVGLLSKTTAEPSAASAAGSADGRSILDIAKSIDPELQARRSAEMRKKNGRVRAFVWKPAVIFLAVSFVLTLATVLYDTQVNDGMIITENNSLCICMSLFVFFPIIAYMALMMMKTSVSFLMGTAGLAAWVYGLLSGEWFSDLIIPLAILSVIICVHVMACSTAVRVSRVDF